MQRGIGGVDIGLYLRAAGNGGRDGNGDRPRPRQRGRLYRYWIFYGYIFVLLYQLFTQIEQERQKYISASSSYGKPPSISTTEPLI